MGAGDLIVVPDTATISEAAALLCRGLEESQRGNEDRLSRGSSQDAGGLGHGSRTASQDEDGSSSSAEGGSVDAEDNPAATLTRWEDWFTLASFSHPHVMSRLERLMGTNVVRITDRKYMLELQRRIREDHVRSVKERIRAREVDELEREKKLILDGRMSLEEAPKELVHHPVFQISQFIKNVLLGGKMASNISSSSRALLTTMSEDMTVATPTTLLASRRSSRPSSVSSRAASVTVSPRDTKDSSPKEGTSKDGSPRASDRVSAGGESPRAEDAQPEAGAAGAAGAAEAGGSPASAQSAKSVSVKEDTTTTEAGVVVHVEDEGASEVSGMSACDFEEDFDRQGDIDRGYMYTQEEFDRIKFEAESVKKMWELETVEELYALAESIVRDMVTQNGVGVPTSARGGDRTPSPARSTKTPPPGGS